jgi:pyruvate/2-oxoacid:ferredoxin oxidoreductase alpha subunit
MENEFQKFVVTDANAAVADVAHSLSDMCFIYPITPCMLSFFSVPFRFSSL